MPQNQKTENFKIPDLPDLTDRQMEFVKGILAGKSASDAYRAAYSTENSLDATVWASASRLRHDPKVDAWLTAARTAALGSGSVTLVNHLQELERLKEIAVKTGNIGAAVNAEVSRGKAAGHYVEKVQDVTKEADPQQLLKEIAGESKEAAQAIARQLGIEMPEEAITRH